MTNYLTEVHNKNSRDNYFQFGNTAWDNHDRNKKKKPKLPKTLKGLSETERKQLNKTRKAWLSDQPLITTLEMEAAHAQIEDTLDLRGSGSPECFGLVGEPFVGKTQIIQQFADKFHCENTDGRPFAKSAETGDDVPPVPVVWLPADKSAKQITFSLLAFYGVFLGSRPTESELTHAMRHHVRQHQTQIVVLDDVHNLRGRNAANGLKVLYEKLGQVMFLFTRTNDECPAFDPKHGGNQTLERTVWQEVKAPKATSKEWVQMLARFEKSMPWCTSGKPQLHQHADLIHDRTGGKTGRLSYLLNRATLELLRTNKDGEDEITAELLKSVKMTNYAQSYAA